MTIEQIRPGYAGEFHCIGEKCEDDCCHAWNILIDRETYEKYESLPDIQPLLKTCIPVNATPTDEGFAQIRSASVGGGCPFLSAERLCGIQQKHGTAYLSRTCAIYPRHLNTIDGQEETTIRLSCPEAVRDVLLNPVLVPAAEAPSTHARYRKFLLKKGFVPQPNGDPSHFFWPVRSFIIALLKDPRYPLWQRLFILGMFCGRLQQLIAEQQAGLIPKLLNDYSDIIVEKKLRAAMEGIPIQAPQQLHVAMEFGASAARDRSGRFDECFKEFLQGIRYDPTQALESCVPAYTEASVNYYRPFMEAQPFILENYLLDYIFGQRLPLTKNPDKPGELVLRDPHAAYFSMCIRFAVIQTMLIGMAGFHRQAFDTQHVVKLVYSFTRAADHGEKFQLNIERYLKEANLIGPNGMALLLKNPSDYCCGR